MVTFHEELSGRWRRLPDELSAIQGVSVNRPQPFGALGRFGVALCATIAVLLVPAAPAWAHNALRESSPTRDAQVASAPERVNLAFAERLDPQFTTIAVTNADKQPVTAGKPTVSGVRATQPLASGLAAGTYTVAYRVVSVDGHPVQGSYTFTVTTSSVTSPSVAASAGPQAPTPDSAPPAAVPSPAAGTASDDDGSGLGIGVVVALLAALAAGLGLLVWRRRVGRR
ncbi:copper resistance CopC family protein [Micromonospora sp. WMMD1155]|uniref:copper resistance CopC family protein n=1 Tax=Micromonospora sp. WMMD1155 TaxID=3016094 RepID=UPI00249C57C9|nr:copper resistance CopC family protein [Micromonospora sp. WMMD1155]WFE53074.1 copper resistance protein CopC [Micromonospora sp. WMMD1155]